MKLKNKEQNRTCQHKPKAVHFDGKRREVPIQLRKGKRRSSSFKEVKGAVVEVKAIRERKLEEESAHGRVRRQKFNLLLRGQ